MDWTNLSGIEVSFAAQGNDKRTPCLEGRFCGPI